MNKISSHVPISDEFDVDSLPPLAEDKAFWGMTLTQFLGAFNDNLFKQMVLLLSIAPIAFDGLGQAPILALWIFSGPLALATISPAIAPTLLMWSAGMFDDGQLNDRQGLANTLFALPFILTTGYAGYLSDKFSKRTIVVWCKVAEIVVMGAGVFAFAAYDVDKSLFWLYVVLFFMGAQSGFFGPAKYGILPEMLRAADLPRANGIMLTTTFLAIILGQFMGGWLIEDYRHKLWVGSAACIVIAVAGTVTSLWVRKRSPADPQLKFEVSSLAVPPDMRKLLMHDRPLLAAVIVSSLFWMLAGMAPAAVNALGIIELHVGAKANSFLLAVVSIGIALGGYVGGRASGGEVNFKLLRIGGWGMVITFFVLALPTLGQPVEREGFDELFALPGLGESRQWLGYGGSLVALTMLGAFTGIFAIPLQVFMQSRPPDDMKGRMIAVMNLANWVGIALSGKIYDALAQWIEVRGWPRCTMFAFIGAMTLPIALFYRPKNEQLRRAN